MKEEIQDFSKQIDFYNLTYHYNDKNDPKSFIGFKGPLSFLRSIKESNISIEKAEEQQREFTSGLNEIVKGSKKSEKSQHFNKCIKDYQ